MKDMKRTKKDLDKHKDADAMSPIGAQNDYPHGLSVHLDHESLSKLGMHKLPKVGDKLHLHAHAHVTSVREEHRDGGKANRHIELQLRKMDLKSHASGAPGEEEMNEGMHQAVDKATKGGYDGAAEADGKAKAAR